MASPKFITPLLDKIGPCLSIGQAPSQGLVYALDRDVVVKVPFQYIIPDEIDDDTIFWIDHAAQSFIAMERELAVYGELDHRPHRNIAQRLKAGPSGCLFLERLQPLERVWATSNERTRYRWVRELLSGMSWLEELGFTHGDIAIRNIGVDSPNCLKLFDFGSATTANHYDYASDVARDHSSLATCLHYILTGVDVFAEVHCVKEVRQIKSKLPEGRETIGAGAEILADIIQSGWTGKAALTKFAQVRANVEAIIGTADLQHVSESTEEHYRRLGRRCAGWLRRATPDPRWLNSEDYCETSKAKGYEVDLDLWR